MVNYADFMRKSSHKGLPFIDIHKEQSDIFLTRGQSFRVDKLQELWGKALKL